MMVLINNMDLFFVPISVLDEAVSLYKFNFRESVLNIKK